MTDYPRFSYRGLLLDSSRHFLPAEKVKRLLDLMALHKLNVLHWHLVDDEGWRIEIKRYPTLTSIGAWRGFNLGLPPALGSGGNRYGGYYSQQQIRDIIAYAAVRNITIIPEIEMPAHARALIMSLKGTLQDKDDRSLYNGVQGYQDNVLSPCLESTYEVLDNILSEVSMLFPSKVIHIGADEVPKGSWKKSERCQTFMAQMGLRNTQELQHYFYNRVQKILQKYHKIPAGWEEILQGGELDSNVWVYHWAKPNKIQKTLQRGYPTVLMPAEHLYFDLAYNNNPNEYGLYWAGYTDTFKTYSFQPVAPNLPNNLVKHIRGIQGALWSEYLISPARLDYMAFPRVAALAEVAWSQPSRRNWQNFSARLGQLHLPRLDNYGVLYRIPTPGIDKNKFLQGFLQANIEFPGLALRYTQNEKAPTAKSKLYQEEVAINPNLPLQMKAFSTNNRSGATAKITNTNEY